MAGERDVRRRPVRRDRLHRRADRRVPRPARAARAALGAGRAQPGPPRRRARPARRDRPGAGRPAAAHRRRDRRRTRCARSPQSARVVASTVGPYVHHGEPLVAACARAGTDYLDITGEPEFVDLMYVRHHAEAVPHRRATGARLRFRLDPARPGRLVHRQAAARRRSDHCGRLRPGRRRGSPPARTTPRSPRSPVPARPAGRRGPAGPSSHARPAAGSGRYPAGWPVRRSWASGPCRCPPSTRRWSAARRRLAPSTARTSATGTSPP